RRSPRHAGVRPAPWRSTASGRKRSSSRSTREVHCAPELALAWMQTTGSPAAAWWMEAAERVARGISVVAVVQVIALSFFGGRVVRPRPPGQAPCRDLERAGVAHVARRRAQGDLAGPAPRAARAT